MSLILILIYVNKNIYIYIYQWEYQWEFPSDLQCVVSQGPQPRQEIDSLEQRSGTQALLDTSLVLIDDFPKVNFPINNGDFP